MQNIILILRISTDLDGKIGVFLLITLGSNITLSIPFKIKNKRGVKRKSEEDFVLKSH